MTFHVARTRRERKRESERESGKHRGMATPTPIREKENSEGGCCIHTTTHIQLTQFRGRPSTAVLISVSISVRISALCIFGPTLWGLGLFMLPGKWGKRESGKAGKAENSKMNRERTKTGKLLFYLPHARIEADWLRGWVSFPGRCQVNSH